MALFVITELGAGSGGTEYELHAVRAFGSRHLPLTAVEQAETGLPEIATAWAVLERARVE